MGVTWCISLIPHSREVHLTVLLKQERSSICESPLVVLSPAFTECLLCSLGHMLRERQKAAPCSQCSCPGPCTAWCQLLYVVQQARRGSGDQGRKPAFLEEVKAGRPPKLGLKGSSLWVEGLWEIGQLMAVDPERAIYADLIGHHCC